MTSNPKQSRRVCVIHTHTITSTTMIEFMHWGKMKFSYAHYTVYYYDRIYALRKNEIQVIIDSQGRAYISDGTMAIHI